MQAIVISENGEEREFLSYVLRHAGLSITPIAAVKTMASSQLKQPVDIIVLSAKSNTAPTSHAFAGTGSSRGQAASDDVVAIRALSQAPLLLLQEGLTEDQTCDLLDAGVDLILKRPYSPRILTRYIKIFLRRAGTVPASILTSIQTDSIRLDPSTRMVTLVGKEPQTLTPLEFRLLYMLMTNPDQVIPLDVIIERVWGYNGEGNRELVRGLVRRLRRKIEPDPDQAHFIHNHPGVGYRFSA
ncbi:Phosphate regulon transcriptional regulatory protein PhoB (SphR) [hydrothermal vent metagenome]|uniref:Phosphate regulon transcriptional regulatory protein PhoB (SphR) n=1 Tax=hydrothermal vent metagenome TaxID=652676 RepID=A0A3B0UYZ6_9ZZZZ